MQPWEDITMSKFQAGAMSSCVISPLNLKGHFYSLAPFPPPIVPTAASPPALWGERRPLPPLQDRPGLTQTVVLACRSMPAQYGALHGSS